MRGTDPASGSHACTKYEFHKSNRYFLFTLLSALWRVEKAERKIHTKYFYLTVSSHKMCRGIFCEICIYLNYVNFLLKNIFKALYFLFFFHSCLFQRQRKLLSNSLSLSRSTRWSSLQIMEKIPSLETCRDESKWNPEFEKGIFVRCEGDPQLKHL